MLRERDAAKDHSPDEEKDGGNCPIYTGSMDHSP